MGKKQYNWYYIFGIIIILMIVIGIKIIFFENINNSHISFHFRQNNINEKFDIFIYGIFSDAGPEFKNSQKEMNVIPGISKKNPLSGTRIDHITVQSLFKNLDFIFNTRIVLNTIYYEDPKKPTKKDILEGLKLFFEEDQDKRKKFILFLSGNNYKDEFIIISKNHNYEKITYKEIADLWLNRKNKLSDNSQHLIIIIDACMSGYWVDKNEELYHNNSFNGISVLSSSNYEKSKDHPDYGGSLIYGINALNNFQNRDLNTKFKDYINNRNYINYTPRFSGFYINIKKLYNLNLFLNGSYENVSSLEYKTVSVDLSKFIGYFRNNKYFLGIYYFYFGDYYEGEYKDQKRNGKGIIYYKSGEFFEGDLKDNRIEGRGTLFYKDGGRYEGEWKNDLTQ